MQQLEMTRSTLCATDATEQQGRSGPSIDMPMSLGRSAPRPAFRLLVWVLLIFALADRLPAAGMWRIVASGVIGLLFLGITAMEMPWR